MKVAVIAFSAKGAVLALGIARQLDCEACSPRQHCVPGVRPMEGSLDDWTAQVFAACDALIFVGACGIAVRAIAPHIRSKTTDPAVVVIDELGRHVIPILSGHIGGANGLARELADKFGAEAVLTTATDIHGVMAVDTWAVAHDCAIENPATIKAVSAEALAHRPVGVAITEQLAEPPFPVTLWLRPRRLVLGVGCRKAVAAEALEAAAEDFLQGAGVSPLSLKAVASIDLKAREPAVLAFCHRHKLAFCTFAAQELARTPGRFASSERVRAVTGVDNVCERAAVRASGGGPLLRSKTIYPGITLALARELPNGGER